MKALYAGSFDPITNGHVDVIKQAIAVFDVLIVGVATNPKKVSNCLFQPDERLSLISRVVQTLQFPNKRIEYWGMSNTLVADLAHNFGAQVLVRGLRAVSDFDSEFQMVQFNRKIGKGINTVFFMPDERNFYLSSSAVREIFNMGGDVSEFVPECVNEAMLKLRSTCQNKEQ